MKQVRQAAHRRESRNRRRLLVFRNTEQLIGFLFFIMIIFISTWVVHSFKNWMDDPEQMVLSQLTLSGEHTYTTEDDLREAILGLGLPNTYIGQDVDDIQQEVMRFPWVKQVSVRKQWPDRLVVYIEEYKPAFYWNDLFLLDKSGNVFSVPLDRIGELPLPRIYGPEGKAKSMLETYYSLENLSKKLANNQLALQITAAISDERNAWQLMVKQCIAGLCLENQDIKLMLGSEHIEERYNRFIKLFPEIQSRIPVDEKITVADLRYENGISVQREKLAQ
ncbi:MULTISPECIES: FtsQ-type POTRA domain-containing protein [unclassified Gilliamella]|uniref:FtsQ-type POTRA domain-containing protein n=1 Tax=unclassified Gilliamella TaxID=2685620 RepID=UPI001C6A4DB9|nr:MULTISPECIES: FtsQ-type POTRA domain-containing protein [unclassified Gilliamella]MCX8600410.1 cell division protein FtsQ/DivIB [Gilliamella sp. B3722]MCX8609406.1 cell division protein FtsQ/DivIB [Gilliamella sp. B3771]MCX8609625.1 cell division protein FtsQ/DivIB [Gilliamella sp. B3891]MCX8612286.1 cell division protein FtsQ/DivIB [Gilliamella sp. B3773]MCX8615706.1 cell division protein FtsQ/DivIB [Gilliamella sp. B3770]